MTTPPSGRPNVIMIVVDDLGWRDLSCTGSDFYETPNIDRLATFGTRFSQAYAGAPNCSPTRASLMSGKAPARVGVTMYIGGHNVGRLADVRSFAQLPRNEYSLARALRAGGYRTWHVGKWHLGGRGSWPDRHGFEINIGGCDWGSPRSYVSPYGCPTLTDGPDGEYLTDRLTDEAIGLIKDKADGDDTSPFFLNLWHYAVHTPLQAPEKLISKYRAKAAQYGITEDDQVADAGPAPYWHDGQPDLRRRFRQGNPVYAAMIENLDWNIGRLLAVLDEQAIADNTIVIFTSDNGGLHSGTAAPTANTPLAEGKGWLDEGGLRIPLIIRAPSTLRHDTVCETPVISADLFPTLLSLTQLPLLPDQHQDGTDLSPLLADRAIADRPLFWHFPHYANAGSSPASAVRNGRWKLIRNYEQDRDVLRDLVSDPGETIDSSAGHLEVVAELRALLDQWLLEVDAQIPLPNPYPPFDEYATNSTTPVSGAEP